MKRMIEHATSTLALVLATGVATAEAQLVFTDVTEEVGAAFTNQLIESVAWGDYDNDGDEDLYLTGDGPNHLLRNDGGGHFTDVTDGAGVGNNRFGVGTAFGDLDNDGGRDQRPVQRQQSASVCSGWNSDSNQGQWQRSVADGRIGRVAGGRPSATRWRG